MPRVMKEVPSLLKKDLQLLKLCVRALQALVVVVHVNHLTLKPLKLDLREDKRSSIQSV